MGMSLEEVAISRLEGEGGTPAPARRRKNVSPGDTPPQKRADTSSKDEAPARTREDIPEDEAESPRLDRLDQSRASAMDAGE